MALDQRHILISGAGFAAALLVQGSALAGGGIYTGPNGQRVTAEVVGNQMILISGNGARTPAPPGICYNCATGQHCPGGQQLRVQTNGILIGMASPRDPAVKMGVQGNAPAGQLAPPPPGSAYKDRSAVKSEIRESAIKGEAIKGEAYKERSGIKGEIKGETKIGGGQGVMGEKPAAAQMGTMPELKAPGPGTQGSR